MAKVDITAHEVREALAYDAETGVFTWRADRKNGSKAGAEAGGIGPRGYRIIHLSGGIRRAHRLAWLYVIGEWPAGSVDHINGIITDNRFSNLRDVPQTFNVQNQRRAQASNALGILGVYQNQRGGYCAKIRANGRNIHLGTFESAELAHAQYLAAKRDLHPGCTI